MSGMGAVAVTAGAAYGISYKVVGPFCALLSFWKKTLPALSTATRPGEIDDCAKSVVVAVIATGGTYIDCALATVAQRHRVRTTSMATHTFVA
jgi:hypothetical protein